MSTDEQKAQIVQTAAKFATHVHARQFRKESHIPYVTHCFEVMKRVATYTDDREVWAAALLHDTIEDTYTTYDMLVQHFNPRIADLVQECTFIGEEKATRADKWDFMESFADKSLESKIIKIADRHCNVIDFRENSSRKGYYATYALIGHPLYKAYRASSPASFPEKVTVAAVESSLTYLNNCIFQVLQVRDAKDMWKIPEGQAQELCGI